MKYKIVISEVREFEVRDTAEVHVHKKSGESIGWSSWYNLDDGEKKNYEKRKEFTGKVERQKEETPIYEQEVSDLNVAELAVYINRAR